MTQKQHGSPTDKARRHVADAEARLARQREVLRATPVDGHQTLAAVSAGVLVTMEADVLLLREHLRQVEELHPRIRPAGRPPASLPRLSTEP